MHIDLNCDMGEGFGRYVIGNDEAVMPLVSSVNVACGFHASDPSTMHRTVSSRKRMECRRRGHTPPFRTGWGSGAGRCLRPPAEIRDDVIYQLGALLAFCKAEGCPFGTSNLTVHCTIWRRGKSRWRRRSRWRSARSIRPCTSSACADPRWWRRPGEAGLKFAAEAFADRGYRKDGRLVSRRGARGGPRRPGGVAGGWSGWSGTARVTTVDGTDIAIAPKTVCVHGDTPFPGRWRSSAPSGGRLEEEKIGG